ncbi:MAG: hypothetical protein WAP91_08000 [Bacilli bacterium]
MRLTEKQKCAIDWIREIQLKFNKDITLRWVDDYWRVCPASMFEDGSVILHMGKVNWKTWQSLINKGYFNKIASDTNDDGFIYVFDNLSLSKN